MVLNRLRPTLEREDVPWETTEAALADSQGLLTLARQERGRVGRQREATDALRRGLARAGSPELYRLPRVGTGPFGADELRILADRWPSASR